MSMSTDKAFVFQNGKESQTIYGITLDTLFGNKILRGFARNFKEMIIPFEQIDNIVKLNHNSVEIYIA